jgi:hypothetical protein
MQSRQLGNNVLELVQLGVKDQSNQQFALLNVGDGTRRVLPWAELEDLHNCSFVEFKAGKYFLVGGTRGGHFSNLAYIVDVRTEKLEKMPPFPVKASHLKLFPVEGKIYCFGGVSESTTPHPVYVFDLVKQTYELLQFIPYAWKDIIGLFGYRDLICLVLNEGRVVCFEPATGDWSFWKKISYRFDFIFAHGDSLFLCDSIAKSIQRYDIENDLIIVQTMFDVKANELLFVPKSQQLFILQHVEDPPYFYQVDLKTFKFEKIEGKKYLDLFGNGVLYRNFPVFSVYPQGTRCPGAPKKTLEKVTPNSAQSTNSGVIRVFGSYELPFELEADLNTSTFEVKPISSLLTLKNSQAVIQLDADSFLFAGGKRSDYSSVGEVGVQRYHIHNRVAKDLKELPLATESGVLAKAGKEIFFLNESETICTYDAATNLWTKMTLKTDANLINYFVYDGRLFLFDTQVKSDQKSDFVVDEYNPATKTWSRLRIPEINFRVQAEFSFQTSPDTFLFIGSDLKQSPAARTPTLFELKILASNNKGSTNIKVERIVKLVDYVVPMSEIRAYNHLNFLLFLLLDSKGKINKVVYDYQTRRVVDSSPLDWFHAKYAAFFESIQLDTEQLKNFKVVNYK